MEKDFIDEFITSKDTRAYLHSIHHEFTDLEKATIVANHIMISYEKKVKWLNNFMNKISDEALKDRISKALIQIKKDRKYYKKCNTTLEALPYNESLFDFVFIPHNFRHGDIVRSLYGDWNTTMFCEKVGIILNYFDKDYEFYKKLKGDYSDVQVCVDIKFDGIAYQGEFEHEHINPIYIERMTLNEEDERRAYLNYLTNLYSKKNTMIEVDNRPEYTGGSDDLLEQRYLDKYIPIQDDVSDIWCVQTGHGFEKGDVNYIAAEFSGMGLIYHFIHNGEMDHVHGFENVLVEILKDPEHVDIVTDYGEYSTQEIQMVKGIKRAVAFVQSHHRPMTNAELRRNRVDPKSLGAELNKEPTYGKGPFFLLVTSDEWNHDDDRWLGIYVNKKEAREAYDRAIVWWSEEQKDRHYSTSQRVAMFEYIAVDDRFREVDRNELG